MKVDNSIKLMSKGKRGITFFYGHSPTQMGLINNKAIVTVEVPVLFYGNNQAGGEIDAGFIGAFT